MKSNRSRTSALSKSDDWKNGFIFIHIPRTGGTSIQFQLTEWLKREKNIPRSISTTKKHRLAQDLKDDWLEMEPFIFTFVRNPWDRMVSLYCWYTQLTGNERWKHYTFDRWLKEGVWKEKYSHTCTQWITRGDKNITNFTGRFENLEEDWSTVCEHLSISRVQKSKNLIHKHRTTHGPYPEYYGRKGKLIVEKHFQDDIRNFGYEF